MTTETNKTLGAEQRPLSRRLALAQVAVALGFVLALVACDDTSTAERPDIPFAPTEDTSLKDPDNPVKVFRVDLAQVENDFPLSRADLMMLTPENITTLSQEELDQIYGRLTAGPVPDGFYQGDLLFARGDTLKTRLDEILGGIGGRVAGKKLELLETVGRTLWKGKMFYRDDMVLRNAIEDFQPFRVIIDDPDTLMTAWVPRGGLLGWIIPETETWLMFPAKLYCGQSLLDSRRESIIIDYFYSDEVPGYRASPDSLAGRGGLKIRDEIRMIRPGFYLGRAYADRFFLLNFFLYDPEVAEGSAEAFLAGGETAEDCWPGEQRHTVATR